MLHKSNISALISKVSFHIVSVIKVLKGDFFQNN